MESGRFAAKVNVCPQTRAWNDSTLPFSLGRLEAWCVQSLIRPKTMKEYHVKRMFIGFQTDTTGWLRSLLTSLAMSSLRGFLERWIGVLILTTTVVAPHTETVGELMAETSNNRTINLHCLSETGRGVCDHMSLTKTFWTHRWRSTETWELQPLAVSPPIGLEGGCGCWLYLYRHKIHFSNICMSVYLFFSF